MHRVRVPYAVGNIRKKQLEEMRLAFDTNKKDRIDNLLSKGKSAKSARIEAETRIEKTEQKIAAEKAELAETTAKLESAETDLRGNDETARTGYANRAMER